MTASANFTRRAVVPLLRFAAYALIVGLVLEAVVAGARGAAASRVVSEDGPVELVQAAIAALAGLVMLPLGTPARPAPQLRVLLALACFFAFARELDGFFHGTVGAHGYQLLAAPIGGLAAWYAWRARAVLPGQMAEFAATPAAALVFAGALIVLVHAQVLGQKEIWEALVPAGDARTVKKTVEECSELTGYLLILFAAIEVRLRH